jgi:tRNA(fMet)-specific endonuclease VapC
LKGHKIIVENLKQAEEVYLPVIVVGELLYGAKKSSQPVRNLKEFRSFIDDCNLIAIDKEISEHYSNIKLELSKKGTPIPENDIWIAATAIYHSIALATNDNHFTCIDNLKIQHWI